METLELNQEIDLPGGASRALTKPDCRCTTCAIQIANLQARLTDLERYIGTFYLASDIPKDRVLQIQSEGMQARAEAPRVFAKAA